VSTKPPFSESKTCQVYPRPTFIQRDAFALAGSLVDSVSFLSRFLSSLLAGLLLGLPRGFALQRPTCSSGVALR
jgi:hypothetical protein